METTMIGREAYQNPWFLADIERSIFGNTATLDRDSVAKAMIPYIEQQMQEYGTPVKSVTRHMMGLYLHQPGAKTWRRALSQYPYEDNAEADVIDKALSQKDDAATCKQC